MKWVEIITLRSHARVDKRLLDELLRQVVKSKTSGDPKEIRMYQNLIVETDLSIHIYWETKPQRQCESPLGQQFSYALRSLGLLNHSIWVETAALGNEFSGVQKQGHGRYAVGEGFDKGKDPQEKGGEYGR